MEALVVLKWGGYTCIYIDRHVYTCMYVCMYVCMGVCMGVYLGDGGIRSSQMGQIYMYIYR